MLTYLRNIVSTRAGRGGSGLAASTLRQYVSNLSSCFCKLGRSEPWDDLARCGNPVASQMVRNHVEMVERGQHAAGRRECSAQPIPRAAVIQLLRHLDEAAAAALRDRDQLEQLRCARDSALVALLWHSCRRGADLLRMHWCHAYAQGTRSLVTDLWQSPASAGVLPTGLHITLDELKNVKRQRPLTIVISTEAGEGAVSCAVRRLQVLYTVQRTFAEPVSLPVFCGYRTVRPPRTALTPSGFSNRFDQLVDVVFAATGTDAYTVHSFRRGRMQYERDHGHSVSDIMQLADLRTESVAHMYLDPGRHLP